MAALCLIQNYLKLVGKCNFCYANQHDKSNLQHLHVNIQLHKAPRCNPIWWHFLLVNVIKTNTDLALPKEFLALLQNGGIFGTHRCFVKGCFSFYIDDACAFKAEILGVVIASHLAWAWHSVWLESDSTLSYFLGVPIKFRNKIGLLE